jgi:hypothetical protein
MQQYLYQPVGYSTLLPALLEIHPLDRLQKSISHLERCLTGFFVPEQVLLLLDNQFFSQIQLMILTSSDILIYLHGF